MRRGLMSLFLVWGTLVSCPAGPFRDAVAALELSELALTFSEEKVARLLPEAAAWIDPESRAAVATLIAVGALDSEAAADSVRALAQLERYQRTLTNPSETVVAPLTDLSALMRLRKLGGHEALRQAAALTDSLDTAIGDEVLTGYGLRRPHVSAATDPERTVIYSHSSLPHVKQLVGLMASEGLQGRVYIAPKIAAFVFREGWGERPEWINELGPGIYVAQGPELLVHFEFEQPGDRQRFDEIVEQFAKKDTEDETGNIINSWWQPYYYCETPSEGYREISRVTLYADEAEASLLMLPERAELVRDHFSAESWPMEVDSIWVSAPFFRFLQGDFK